MSNIRPEGQNYPIKDSNPAHKRAQENVKEGIYFGLLNEVLQIFLLIKASPMAIHTRSK